MKNEVLIRLLNVGLRGLSMGSRFLLIFVVAKLLEPTDMGLFGLMLATISFSVLVVGADYYTYSHRELLARPIEQWPFVIQHQIRAQIILYIIFLPILLFIFILDFMDWQYVIWFFALLVTEHIAQEINRLLVVMHKQLLASCILFLRMGSWVLVLVPIMYYFPSMRTLSVLYAAWFIGSFLAVLAGIIIVQSVTPMYKKAVILDSSWIKKGFKIGAGFLVATLCFKFLITFDRYAVDTFGTGDILGVYVFYISIVFGMYTFLEPSVFAFVYPKMLQSYQAKNKFKYKKAFNELIISTTLISLMLALLMFFIMPVIINWIDKPIYFKYLSNFNLLIIVGFVYGIGFIPHYALYAMKGDRWITVSHVSSLVIFFYILWDVQLDNAIQLVGMALLFAFSWVLFIKMIGYLYIKKQSILLSS